MSIFGNILGKIFHHDSAKADAQRTGHQATLDALKAYSASGDVPSLKAFATKMVPIVTGHLNMAKSL